MQHIQIQDDEGSLVGTIAYQADGRHVYYGCAIVSPTEPEDVVTFEDGLRRAISRLANATLQSYSEWKDHPKKPNKRVALFRKMGFERLGRMSKNKFKSCLSQVVV